MTDIPELNASKSCPCNSYAFNLYVCVYTYTCLRIREHIYVHTSVTLHPSPQVACPIPTDWAAAAGVADGSQEAEAWLKPRAPQGLLLWLFNGGFKVSLCTVECYTSSSGIDFDNSEMASPVLPRGFKYPNMVV